MHKSLFHSVISRICPRTPRFWPSTAGPDACVNHGPTDLPRRLGFGLLGAVLLLAASLAGTPVRAQVATDIVGIWENFQPDDFGGTRQMLEITADGRFALSDRAMAHYYDKFIDHGRFQAAEGAWTARSGIGAWRDGGAYSLRADGALVLEGKDLRGEWTRTALVPSFGTVDVASLWVPTGVQDLARDVIRTVAKPWSADARLMLLHVNWYDAVAAGVRMTFHSARKGADLDLVVRRFRRERIERRSDGWDQKPLFERFIDLPAAFEVARDRGLKGEVYVAELRLVPGFGFFWTIHPNEGDAIGVGAVVSAAE